MARTWLLILTIREKRNVLRGPDHVKGRVRRRYMLGRSIFLPNEDRQVRKNVLKPAKFLVLLPDLFVAIVLNYPIKRGKK